MTDRSRPDYVLFFTVMILVSLGLLMIYSASAFIADANFKDSTYFFKKQLIWILLSLPLLLLFMHLDYHKLRFLVTPFMLLSLILLVAVLFFPPFKSVKRWIRLGPFGFQPTEVFKYAFILFLSFSLAKQKEKIKKFRHVLPYFLVLFVASVLIIREPHLGSIFCLWIIFMVMIFVAGSKIRYLMVLTLPFLLIAGIMVWGLGYEKDRVESYLRAIERPLDGDYQAKQAALTLGSGGWMGNGLGEGKQKLFYLPEPHTDFIFATIGEEGGFVALMGISLLFFLFGLRGLGIALKAPDVSGFLLVCGITAAVMIGFFINTMVVIGLLPTTGIPLPFLSYGGSSLLVTLAGVGILLNVSRQRLYMKKNYRRITRL
ncbi:MAG: putative lipid II flippase FtsW [Candidatus Zixiibacteriota bacterium]